MSDEEGLGLEDVGAAAEEAAPAGRKIGFLPAFLIRILKWVALGLAFIILGVTTTVITFSLVNRGKRTSDLSAISPSYSARAEPLQYDDSMEEIRGVTADDVPAIFSAKVSFGFDIEATRVAFELSARKRQIQNLVLITLSQKKKDELRPEHYMALQEELKMLINKVMKEGQVKEVIFREFVVAQ